MEVKVRISAGRSEFLEYAFMSSFMYSTNTRAPLTRKASMSASPRSVLFDRIILCILPLTSCSEGEIFRSRTAATNFSNS